MHDHDLTALSKTLSAALLQHQISELESRVQSVQLKEQPVQSAGRNRIDDTRRSAIPGAARDTQATTPPQKLGRIDDGDADELERAEVLTHDDAPEPSEFIDEADEAWRAVVLDASVLIWALRSVRRLVNRGWEVIVPLETIKTLDLLKKGPSHTATGARAATRYIEHASRQHKPLSADPSLTVQSSTHYKRGLGLRVQRDAEHIPISHLSELPIPLDDVPRWLTNVLACAGYFARVNAAEVKDVSDVPRPTLFVANPPLAVEALGEEKDVYTERGEGYLISQEAERFEMGLEVLRDEEIEDMAFDADGRRGRGMGRGRGRGGERGGGRGGAGRGRGGKAGGAREQQQEEPEREVKILLRRPAPAPAAQLEQSAGDVSSLGRSVDSPDTTTSPLPPAPELRPKGSPLAPPRSVLKREANLPSLLLKRDTHPAAGQGAGAGTGAPHTRDAPAPRYRPSEGREPRVRDNEPLFTLLKRPEPRSAPPAVGAAGGDRGHGHRDAREAHVHGHGHAHGLRARRRRMSDAEGSSDGVRAGGITDGDGEADSQLSGDEGLSESEGESWPRGGYADWGRGRGRGRGGRGGGVRSERLGPDGQRRPRGEGRVKRLRKAQALAQSQGSAEPKDKDGGVLQSRPVKLLQRSASPNGAAPMPAPRHGHHAPPPPPQPFAGPPGHGPQHGLGAPPPPPPGHDAPPPPPPPPPPQPFALPSFLSADHAKDWRPPPEFRPRDATGAPGPPPPHSHDAPPFHAHGVPRPPPFHGHGRPPHPHPHPQPPPFGPPPHAQPHHPHHAHYGFPPPPPPPPPHHHHHHHHTHEHQNGPVGPPGAGAFGAGFQHHAHPAPPPPRPPFAPPHGRPESRPAPSSAPASGRPPRARSGPERRGNGKGHGNGNGNDDAAGGDWMLDTGYGGVSAARIEAVLAAQARADAAQGARGGEKEEDAASGAHRERERERGGRGGKGRIRRAEGNGKPKGSGAFKAPVGSYVDDDG